MAAALPRSSRREIVDSFRSGVLTILILSWCRAWQVRPQFGTVPPPIASQKNGPDDADTIIGCRCQEYKRCAAGLNAVKSFSGFLMPSRVVTVVVLRRWRMPSSTDT